MPWDLKSTNLKIKNTENVYEYSEKYNISIYYNIT